MTGPPTSAGHSASTCTAIVGEMAGNKPVGTASEHHGVASALASDEFLESIPATSRASI